MKHQTRKSNIIGIIFAMSIMTSPSSHADWNDINPFSLGTSAGIFNLAQSANSMVIQSPGFASFAARHVPQQYSYIFSLPFNNSYTQSINTGVTQFFSGGGCSLGIGNCNALNQANSLFSYNTPLVSSFADRCIQLHGYAKCKEVGF